MGVSEIENFFFPQWEKIYWAEPLPPIRSATIPPCIHFIATEVITYMQKGGISSKMAVGKSGSGCGELSLEE